MRRSVSKDSPCLPNAFLFTSTSNMPSRGWPVVPRTLSLLFFERSISPAHVPSAGKPSFNLLLSLDKVPFSMEREPIAVLSPPGKTIESTASTSCGVFTSMTLPSSLSSSRAFSTALTCSSTSPSTDNTPTLLAIQDSAPLSCILSSSCFVSMPSIDFLSSIIFCASATTFASSQYVVASTIALALSAGSSLLNIPEPTNIPSQPSCIIKAASAGVAIPPAAKLTTGSLPVWQFLQPARRRPSAPLQLSSAPAGLHSGRFLLSELFHY